MMFNNYQKMYVKKELKNMESNTSEFYNRILNKIENASLQ